MSKAQGATLVRRFFSAPLYGGRAQGALGRAGFRAHRSTNLRTAATRSFLVLSVMHLVELAKGYVDKSLDTLATH